jgi:predicted transcriptional regulator
MNRKLAARCLAELGNLTRLDIYRLLVRAGPPGLNITDIQTRLDVPASTLAFHLRGLVGAGLVAQEKKRAHRDLPRSIRSYGPGHRVLARALLRGI